MIKATGLETDTDWTIKNMYCRVGFSEAIWQSFLKDDSKEEFPEATVEFLEIIESS